MNYCVDCGKEIGKRSPRCRSCASKAWHKPTYKQGYRGTGVCLDCGIKIDLRAKRCQKCTNKILGKNNRKEYTKNEIEKMLTLLEDGLTYHEIGKKFNCSGAHIRRLVIDTFGKEKYNDIKQHTLKEAGVKLGKLQRRENHPNWQGGLSFLPYCSKFTKALKEKIRNFFARKCYVCGKTEEENGRKLDVYHVNYDKMVCCNTIKPLFVPLCLKCHLRTNRNREFWEEFFTVSLEYLTNGKCF